MGYVLSKPLKNCLSCLLSHVTILIACLVYIWFLAKHKLMGNTMSCWSQLTWKEWQQVWMSLSLKGNCILQPDLAWIIYNIVVTNLYKNKRSWYAHTCPARFITPGVQEYIKNLYKLSWIIYSNQLIQQYKSICWTDLQTGTARFWPNWMPRTLHMLNSAEYNAP